MRVYNGTKTQLMIPTPLGNKSIGSMSVGEAFIPNKDFLSLMANSFTKNEIALIIGGVHEISMCSNVDGVKSLTVNSLEEAIFRFAPDSAKNTDLMNPLLNSEDGK